MSRFISGEKTAGNPTVRKMAEPHQTAALSRPTNLNKPITGPAYGKARADAKQKIAPDQWKPFVFRAITTGEVTLGMGGMGGSATRCNRGGRGGICSAMPGGMGGRGDNFFT